MGRTVDQEVHAAFVEFRAKEDDKCLSVQCIYCQQIRAKNTSRQKQHLLECPGLRGHPNAPQPQGTAPGPNGIGPANGYNATPNGPAATAPGAGPGPAAGTIGNPNGPMMSNGVNPPIQAPLQNMQNRPSLPAPGAAQGTSGTSSGPVTQQRSTKSKNRQSTSNLPAPPLDDVHAAFVEFRAKEEDKVRAKNTSRQRQHLLECPTYLNVMKDSIPANNLLHTFPEGDIARSLQIPVPSLELDFRLSLKINPKPGGQSSELTVKELATQVSYTFMLQTGDENPGYIAVKATAG
ncbi:hypothetical protein T310_8342 [Rasamsonia emersonii CBS 393.64]|uniref:Uncharacterized protein n=1 Tax=Rasamsonia emersonii (strain ATCC 16479 / CBS 393.64 / IMI 116815) TaxID=1408163 RepID=A0A0F4YIM9_RASE3|nr:hypothetical protein T310_8342 [Rasamsonia emersonii CBS 393.64]KKA17721.1 hypothetical protein T310_8342 [Rasamsonia emersonii CBS 393.64]